MDALAVAVILISILVAAISLARSPSVEDVQRRCDEMNKRTCRYCGGKGSQYQQECVFCGAELRPNAVHWEVGF